MPEPRLTPLKNDLRTSRPVGYKTSKILLIVRIFIKRTLCDPKSSQSSGFVDNLINITKNPYKHEDLL
jgi:hypothetical protein